MRLQIPLILLLQVAWGESLSEVFGYLGDNITLPSGVKPSGTLTSIEWSIFSNSTFIATFRTPDRENIKRVRQYDGRLSLNRSSGDLMIYNLTAQDAMEYSVELNDNDGRTINKIRLTVTQRLQKPSIQSHIWVSGESTKRGCWMEVRCSSSDEDVKLSWEINPNVTDLCDHNSALLLAFVNTTNSPVNFICTASRSMEETSSFVTLTCKDDKPKPTPRPQSTPQPRERCFLSVFFVGGFLTMLITAIIIGNKIKKRKIKATSQIHQEGHTLNNSVIELEKNSFTTP